MIDIARGGEGGYAYYRIPAIAATKAGTLLAAYECRLSQNDWDTRAVALRRSIDGGVSFGETVYIASNDSVAVNNPLLLCTRVGRILYIYQLNYERVFARISEDDGVCFSPAFELTSAFDGFRDRFDHTVCATGPGHGLELENGRLIVPVWLSNSPQREHKPSVCGVIMSDDSGLSWKSGGIVGDAPDMPNLSETTAVQLPDGRIMLNIRNDGEKRRHALSFSDDGGETWSAPVFEEAFVDPVCFSSTLRTDGRIFYSGCDCENDRRNLTIRVSEDNGGSWSVFAHVYDKAGYSDIAAVKDAVFCLFERDELSAISLERLPLREKAEK